MLCQPCITAAPVLGAGLVGKVYLLTQPLFEAFLSGGGAGHQGKQLGTGGALKVGHCAVVKGRQYIAKSFQCAGVFAGVMVGVKCMMIIGLVEALRLSIS